jgi:hypothetical protein
MPLQIYRLTPKYGVSMREARSSSARIAPPVTKMMMCSMSLGICGRV